MLVVAAFIITALIPAGRVHGQSWSAKPIHIISPIGAGSAADILSRAFAEQLSLQLGQPVVVENRPGAGGTLGANAVAESEPDGYTILEAQHIPFKAQPEALTEVLAGRVDFYFCPVFPALPFISEGKLIPLAVGSAQRISILPDVPTTVEAGFANSDYNFWVGMFVPAKTSSFVGKYAELLPPAPKNSPQGTADAALEALRTGKEVANGR